MTLFNRKHEKVNLDLSKIGTEVMVIFVLSVIFKNNKPRCRNRTILQYLKFQKKKPRGVERRKSMSEQSFPTTAEFH